MCLGRLHASLRKPLSTAALAGSLAVLAVTSSGCTKEWYRDDADRQVQKLIKESQQNTTGYTPEATAATTAEPAPSPKAYAKVPVTRVLEPAIVPMFSGVDEPIEGPLGPPVPTAQTLPPTESEIYSSSARTRNVEESYGPPAELGRTIYLDLFSAIKYAVQHSRQYQTEMEQLYLAALDVTLERHLFTPRPFARTELRYTGGQEDIDYRSAYSVTQRVGVRQQLPFGGEIVAEGLVDFVNALRGNVADGENAQLAIRGAIPLWRGAGLINLEPLISSERELIYQTRDFENYRRTFAVEVASRYLSVLIRYYSVRNRFLNYRNLRDLVERTEALFDAGRVTALEVQRAQQSLLNAEDTLNNAQLTLESNLDDFKIFIGMPVDQPVELGPMEVEVAAVDRFLRDPEQTALRYRLDLQTARDRVDDARRIVANAANGLAPQLDLTGGATIGNRPNTPARQIDEASLEYEAGLTLDLPIDRLPERNSYRRALILLEQRQRSVVELEENILADVRARERGVQSSQYSLDIQRNGIELARRRLEFATESLLLGRVQSTRDVVEAQNSLLSAQDAYERARADLQVQMLQFLRDTGTLRIDAAAGELGLAMDRNLPEVPPTE